MFCHTNYQICTGFRRQLANETGIEDMSHLESEAKPLDGLETLGSGQSRPVFQRRLCGPGHSMAGQARAGLGRVW
jgi:hypothetical protein